MGRVLAIDYGLKRVGIAVSDPLQIISGGLDTIANKDIFTFLKTYTELNQVDTFVVGYPKNLNNTPTHCTKAVEKFMIQLKNTFPEQKIYPIDERYTSAIAARTVYAMGMKKKDRQNKKNLDKISATILLQDFLSLKGFQKTL